MPLRTCRGFTRDVSRNEQRSCVETFLGQVVSWSGRDRSGREEASRQEAASYVVSGSVATSSVAKLSVSWLTSEAITWKNSSSEISRCSCR